MKKVIFIGLVSLLVSCKKQKLSPYTQAPEPVDTTVWQDSYSYGGVLPNLGGSSQTLVGTKWVLRKVVAGFSITYPNDTIKFISNSSYVLNQNGQRPYTISGITGSTNKSLTLYFFLPFGGSNYSGQVGQYFISDGFMNNTQFIDLQNNTYNIIAFFEKI
jgi:hypothetical protein